MATAAITANRRALLAGGLVAAIGGVTAAPVAAQDNRDAELLKLGDAWRQHARLCDAADKQIWELERLHSDLTPRPAALDWLDSDSGFRRRAIDTQWFEQNGWQGRDVEGTMLRIISPPNGFVVNLSLAPRAREIYDAHRAWTEARERVNSEIGLAEAERKRDLLADENFAVRSRIAAAPAYTPTGVALKAEIAAWCYGGMKQIDSDIQHRADINRIDSEGMMGSLTLDILRNARLNV